VLVAAPYPVPLSLGDNLGLRPGWDFSEQVNLVDPVDLEQLCRRRPNDAEVGQGRSVPLAPAVAMALARLSQRALFTGEDDLVFRSETGSFLDGSALRRRYKAALRRADLRPLRFHDLRHTFGTRMIAKADIRRVQEWMGHADIQTTMRYLHYAPEPRMHGSSPRPLSSRSTWRQPRRWWRIDKGLRDRATSKVPVWCFTNMLRW
jgi:integrase